MIQHTVPPVNVLGPLWCPQGAAGPGPRPHLCVFPDGEFLTLGLLECIDWNPELAATNRDGLTEFLSGCSRNGCWGQWQGPTACWLRPLALTACTPFSSLFFSCYWHTEVSRCVLRWSGLPIACNMTVDKPGVNTTRFRTHVSRQLFSAIIEKPQRKTWLLLPWSMLAFS